MARRRYKRRVSYKAAFVAAALLVARKELQRRTGLPIQRAWTPLMLVLLQRASKRLPTARARRLGSQLFENLSARRGNKEQNAPV
jgi:hypothetical protein